MSRVPPFINMVFELYGQGGWNAGMQNGAEPARLSAHGKAFPQGKVAFAKQMTDEGNVVRFAVLLIQTRRVSMPFPSSASPALGTFSQEKALGKQKTPLSHVRDKGETSSAVPLFLPGQARPLKVRPVTGACRRRLVPAARGSALGSEVIFLPSPPPPRTGPAAL